jgi:Flp pilus assembly pilin Flp
MKPAFSGRHIRNEKGSAMIEFAMMMPLFVIMIVFLMICYQGVNKYVTSQVKAYSDMRSKVNSAGGGRMRIVRGTARDKVLINRAMARWTGHSMIPVKITVSSYGGTCAGLRKNRYRRSDIRYNLP